MKRAFADPHYQRYRYRPDCRLHGRRRSAPPPQTASSDDDLRQRCRSTSAAARHRVVMATVVVMATLVASTLARISVWPLSTGHAPAATSVL